MPVWTCVKCDNVNHPSSSTCLRCSPDDLSIDVPTDLSALTLKPSRPIINNTPLELPNTTPDSMLHPSPSEYFNQATYSHLKDHNHLLQLAPYYKRIVNDNGMVQYAVNPSAQSYSPQAQANDPLFIREHFLVEKNVGIVRQQTLANSPTMQPNTEIGAYHHTNAIVEPEQLDLVIKQDINTQFDQFDENGSIFPVNDACCMQPHITAITIINIILLIHYLTKRDVDNSRPPWLLISSTILYFIMLLPSFHYIILLIIGPLAKPAPKLSVYQQMADRQEPRPTNSRITVHNPRYNHKLSAGAYTFESSGRHDRSYYNPYKGFKTFSTLNILPHDALFDYIYSARTLSSDPLVEDTELTKMLSSEPILYSYIKTTATNKALLRHASQRQIPIIAAKDITPPIPLVKRWLSTFDASMIQLRFVYNFEIPIVQENDLITWQNQHKKDYAQSLLALSKSSKEKTPKSECLAFWKGEPDLDEFGLPHIQSQLHYLLPGNTMLLSSKWNNTSLSKSRVLSAIFLNPIVATLLMFCGLFWVVITVYHFSVTPIHLSTTKYLHLSQPLHDDDAMDDPQY